MKRKTKQTNLSGNFTHLPSNVECQEIFVKNLPKKREGANCYVDDFCKLSFSMLTTLTVFSVNELLQLCKVRDLPAEIMAGLFFRWCSTLEKLGRLKKIPANLYDYDQYQVIGFQR